MNITMANWPRNVLEFAINRKLMLVTLHFRFTLKFFPVCTSLEKHG